MITKQELLNACLGGQPDAKYKLNIDEYLRAINIVRQAYGKPMYVSCFYRSTAWDKAKGRSGLSQHTQCRACDFRDTDGKLDAWCMANLDVLAKASLWLEHPNYTKGWCHLDLKQRKNRVFMP